MFFLQSPTYSITITRFYKIQWKRDRVALLAFLKRINYANPPRLDWIFTFPRKRTKYSSIQTLRPLKCLPFFVSIIVNWNYYFESSKKLSNVISISLSISSRYSKPVRTSPERSCTMIIKQIAFGKMERHRPSKKSTT